MTSLAAQVIAIEKRAERYQVIVQIGTKYRGSFNTLAFGEIKPYSGSPKDGRLDLASVTANLTSAGAAQLSRIQNFATPTVTFTPC